MRIQGNTANWSVNSTCVNSVVQAAKAQGAAVDHLLLDAGIEQAQLADPDARHSLTAFYSFYRRVAAVTTPDLGLYAGRVDYISRLNLQLYTCSVCDNFRDYLNTMPSALQFAGDVGEMRIRRAGDEIRLDWLPLWEPEAGWRFQSDELLSTAATIVGSLCVLPIPVKRACFTYPKPKDTQLLAQIFGPNLFFDQEVSCLFFDRAALDYPLIQVDTEWSRAISHSTMHLFESDPVIAEIRRVLQRLLPTGDVSVDRVAESLGISRRTLQRRLAQRRTQFVQVLQDLRYEMALQYLSDDHLSVTDIAFLLGYGDQGSFSSAFKLRNGHSPREFRRHTD